MALVAKGAATAAQAPESVDNTAVIPQPEHNDNQEVTKVNKLEQISQQAVAAEGEIAEGVLGSLSSSWELVQLLQNAAKPDRYPVGVDKERQRVKKEKDAARKEIKALRAAGKEVPEDLIARSKQELPADTRERVDVGTTVGFEIKALQDGLKYPYLELTPYNRDVAAYRKPDAVTEWKTAKKGEIVALSKLEFALLLSEKEYNGFLTGGPLHVGISISYPERFLAGNLEITNKVAPTIHVRSATPGQSIKRFQSKTIITPKADSVKTAFALSDVKVTKGYERFAALYEAKPKPVGRTEKTASKAVSATTVRDAGLSVFASLYNKK